MDRRNITSRLNSEEGQVWSWVLRILLVAFVIGVLITQAGPVISNHVAIKGTANEAADVAARTYQSTRGNMTRVNDDVQKFLEDHDARLAGSIIINYGELGKASTISVPVRKIANTFIFKSIGYLSSYTEAFALGEGNIY